VTHLSTCTWRSGRPRRVSRSTIIRARPGSALVAAVHAAEIVDGARVWAAGEAAAMQRIRRYLFEERGIARPLTTVRGYWKHGRAGDNDGD
jgi:NADPH-dependent ferric siderophore reductase